MDNIIKWEQLNAALYNTLKKIDKNSRTFIKRFPDHASVNYIYPRIKNGEGDWSSGFWTGMLWLAYELTGEKRYKKLASSHKKPFRERLIEELCIGHHDMGFLFSPSMVAEYKITGQEEAKRLALEAADILVGRFTDNGNFIQAWGELGVKDNYRLIIDCLMNVPLLIWASEVTGNNDYREKALKHIETTLNVIIREDGSTHHTYFFNLEDGSPDRGETGQGYADDSAWARGQAWGIYGFALAYSFTKEEKYLKAYKKVTNYFVKHLPKDRVPYWDLCFTDGSGQERDTSAASIAICGILEMEKHFVDDEILEHKEAALTMMASLMEHYTTKDIEESNGILTQGVYYMKGDVGIDECLLWGDYFYVEALVRILKKDWKRYW